MFCNYRWSSPSATQQGACVAALLGVTAQARSSICLPFPTWTWDPAWCFDAGDNAEGQDESPNEPLVEITNLYYRRSYKPHRESSPVTLGAVPMSNKELLSRTTHHLDCWQDATGGENTGTRCRWISIKIAWRKAEVPASPFPNHLFIPFGSTAQMQMT